MHLKPLVHLKSGLHRNPISSEHQQTYLVWVEIFLISSHQRLISLGEKEKAKPQEAAGCVGLKFYYLNSYLNQPSGIKKACFHPPFALETQFRGFRGSVGLRTTP